MKTLFSFLAVLFLFIVSNPLFAKTSPEAIAGATTVDVAKAKQLFDNGVIFVDTRKQKDWDGGRIPDAVHLDVEKDMNKDSLAKDVKLDQEVVMYCNGHSCLRSSEAAKLAVDLGYTKVYYFRDGFPAWKAAGYPVE